MKFTPASEITTGGDNILYEMPPVDQQIDTIHLTLKNIEERLDKLEGKKENKTLFKNQKGRIMHTQIKWEVVQLKSKHWCIVQIDMKKEKVKYITNEVYTEANANRIVQTNNSFDGLLEACKSELGALEHVAKEEIHVNWITTRDTMRKAIAQAEE